jgi:hypothetical protein
MEMSREKLSLNGITNDVKTIMHKMDECRDNQQIAILIYGMYQAQRENNDLSLEETIESSQANWLDLF